MPSAHQASRHNGFTLIELLMAVSLSSVVIVVLMGGFYIITNDWQKQDSVLENKIDDSLIHLEIERAILGTFPYSFTSKEEKQEIFYFGDSDSLTFVSTFSPAYNNQLTLWQIKSNQEGGLDIHALSAQTGDPKEILEEINSSQDEKDKPTQVFRDKKIQFSYLSEDKNGNRSWVNQWDAIEERLLPRAVKITLESFYEEQPTIYLLAMIPAYQHQTIRPLINLKNKNPLRL